jgi:hypothetical protein
MASTATRNSISSGTTARTRSAAEPKGYGESAGQTLSRSERADELKALRGRWEEMCNAHLDRASIEARIDMRSHAERGTGLAPEVKQLPSQWRDPQQRANVIDFREARREQQAANENLSREIPDAGAEIVSFGCPRAAGRAGERDRRRRAGEGMDGHQKEMVRSRSQRAEALSGRIYGEVEQIGRERFRRRQEHMKTARRSRPECWRRSSAKPTPRRWPCGTKA